MSDNVENMLLEHLKRFQATLERIERKLGSGQEPPSQPELDDVPPVVAVHPDQAELERRGQFRIELKNTI